MRTKKKTHVLVPIKLLKELTKYISTDLFPLDTSLTPPVRGEGVKGRKRFIPPTVDQITKYATKMGYDYIDPKQFFNFYHPTWKDTYGNKIKNWKNKVQTWNRRCEKQPKFREIFGREPSQKTKRSKGKVNVSFQSWK